MGTPSRGVLATVDRATDGKIGQLIAEWRSENLSFTEVAFRLRDHGVVVTPETVRRWAKDQPTEARS